MEMFLFWQRAFFKENNINGKSFWRGQISNKIIQIFKGGWYMYLTEEGRRLLLQNIYPLTFSSEFKRVSVIHKENWSTFYRACDDFELQLSSPIDLMGLNKSKYQDNNYKLCLGRSSWNNKGSGTGLLMQAGGCCKGCLLFPENMNQVRSMLPGGCALPGFSLASDPWEDSHHPRSTAKSQILLKAAWLRSSGAVQGQTSPVALPNVRELKNTVQFILQAWMELQKQVCSTWEISLARFSHSFKLIYGLGGHGHADVVLNGNSALWSSHSPCKFSRLCYPFTKANQMCVCAATW